MTDDRQETGTPPNADRTPTGVSVAEAVSRLGVSADAVRARIRRGSLDAVKHDGVWLVTLPENEHDTGQDIDTTQPDTDRNATALIDQLKSENEYLRDRLSDMIQQAATERERADVLQREALQRVEALTAGSIDRQRGAHEAVGSSETGTTAPDDSAHEGGDQRGAGSLWHRVMRALRGA